ncbi:MAG: bifunctional folylpolyglutamate synthase/dihydrofolate synthase [Lachnospiraceae bacterium]|nr:bifunctional folylpolyglutamate synthase/dihydrofolate synthase [Lachnospiraceae bacterium]
MTYTEVIETIEQSHRFGKASGYEVSREMLDVLEHPEHGKRIIHIAGTNGKGSTAVYVSNILQAAGFCVGMFTSPHLIDFTERIQVDGKQIPPEDVVRLGERLLSLPLELEPTMFDYCLGMALLYFQEAGCDYIVLETGLGGRLDSTNGIGEIPVVSVVTRIGFDHMAYLGNTLEAIAGEKAGILKPGTRAVLAVNDSKADEVLREACVQREIDYLDLNDTANDEIRSFVMDHRDCILPGAYQVENAMNAVATAYLLEQMGVFASVAANRTEFEALLVRGLSQSYWPGRMEEIATDPVTIVDGAHNPQGVAALRQSVEERFPGVRCIFVMAVMADKDYEHMIEELLPLAREFYTVTVSSDRALQGSTLAGRISAHGVSARYYEDMEQALQEAREKGRKEQCPVIAFGSLYFIGSILEKVKTR